MAKTSSKGINLEAVHSALLEVKSTVSSIWDKLVGLESKLEKFQNENVKLKQENQKHKRLMHTEYLWTDELDQYNRRKNVRILGIREDHTAEDEGKKQLLKLAGELNISLQEKVIQRVHRLGKKKKSKAAKPRGITACFVSYAKKEEFIEKRKNLKGIKIAVCEDLTSTRYKL